MEKGDSFDPVGIRDGENTDLIVTKTVMNIMPLFEDVIFLFGDAIGELPGERGKEYLDRLNGIMDEHNLDLEFSLNGDDEGADNDGT